jgi:hypothetical protein
MSITPYLDEFDADPETMRVLAVALEMTRVSLGLTDDLADGIIAKQIVELAKTGERNPNLLCEAALSWGLYDARGEFGGPKMAGQCRA